MLKRAIASAILIAMLLAVPVRLALADDPVTPTPTASAEAGPPEATSTPEPTLVTQSATEPSDSPPAADPAQPGESLAAAAQVTATPNADPPTPTPSAQPRPSTPTPTGPATTPSPATSYVAVLVGETVVTSGGGGSSEVFVSFVDIESGIREFELRLTFDPDIIRVKGQDGPEITTRSPIDAASVDNEKGVIVLALRRTKGTVLQSTNTWEKIATIAWVARQEGKSVVAIDKASTFITAAGERITPDATYDGVVFVRAPGTLLGRILLQGRNDHSGVSISSSLSKSRSDTVTTDKDGRFAITTSHGEGFYTITVAKQGYLTAVSERPLKMTVDSVVDLGEITLIGGDVNGDNEIDVRDLSYVAWHFDEEDVKADINGDGVVDILDLSLIAGNFGRKGPIEWKASD